MITTLQLLLRLSGPVSLFSETGPDQLLRSGLIHVKVDEMKAIRGFHCSVSFALVVWCEGAFCFLSDVSSLHPLCLFALTRFLPLCSAPLKGNHHTKSTILKCMCVTAAG